MVQRAIAGRSCPGTCVPRCQARDCSVPGNGRKAGAWHHRTTVATETRIDTPQILNPRPIGGRYALVMQVLVVEDDQPLVRILTKSLESNGFDVASAFDGETGL